MGFSNYAEQEWLKQYYRQFETWKKYFRGQQWSIEKEQDMNKSMGHFTNWKFGVPVKVIGQKNGCNYGNGRLIYETASDFAILRTDGLTRTYSKAERYYELIPYKIANAIPRYPICQQPEGDGVYCNSYGTMENTGNYVTPPELIPEPTATLIIDGKEIKLSAETAARLKKELGG